MATKQITVALPKGRIMESTIQFFEQAGIHVPENSGRKLILESEDGTFRYILCRASDVVTYVEYGVADVGIAGLDKLRESERNVYEPLLLPFGHCRLALCGLVERPDVPLRYMSQPSVATSFPKLTARFFREQGINAEVIRLSGSVELAPLLGLSDLIVDLVETGSTLRANGLTEIETIMEIQSVLIVNRVAQHSKSEAVEGMIEMLREAI